MKKENIVFPYLTKLIKKLAPKVGARVVIEPEWGIAFQLVYKNGVVRSFIDHLLDLNALGSSEIAGDKGYAKFFISKLGYPVAKGTNVYSDAWAKTVKSKHTISYGIKYAKKLGYPVVVKPNSKSQGKDVYVIFDQKELTIYLKEIFKNDKVAVLERYLPGRDYRMVVLKEKVLYAYERIPLSVTGNGKNSILSILKKKRMILNGKKIRIDPNDKRIKLKLKHQGYTLLTILPKGLKVFLLDNANLSAGAIDVYVTKEVHPGFKKIAVNLTRDMGLQICGIDIMLTKGDISESPKNANYYIIEINSALGLEPIEATYYKILKALGKRD